MKQFCTHVESGMYQRSENVIVFAPLVFWLKYERFHSSQRAGLLSDILDDYIAKYRRENPVYLTFRHRASCILGQAFHYSPVNAFYTRIFNQ